MVINEFEMKIGAVGVQSLDEVLEFCEMIGSEALGIGKGQK